MKRSSQCISYCTDQLMCMDMVADFGTHYKASITVKKLCKDQRTLKGNNELKCS